MKGLIKIIKIILKKIKTKPKNQVKILDDKIPKWYDRGKGINF
jgi:hypothetical protein